MNARIITENFAGDPEIGRPENKVHRVPSDSARVKLASYLDFSNEIPLDITDPADVKKSRPMAHTDSEVALK